MKTQLNDKEKLIALGLFTLGNNKNNELKAVVKSLAQVVDEPADQFGYYNVLDDFVYGDETPDQKLSQLLRCIEEQE